MRSVWGTLILWWRWQPVLLGQSTTPDPGPREALQQQREQNQLLRKQLHQQADQIEELRQAVADDGFAVIGNRSFGELFSPALVTRIHRLSRGLGYRWSEQLLLKTEYTWEQSRTLGGAARNHENLMAAEVAFRF